MPMPPGGRPPGPREFLTEEEKLNKPTVTKELLLRIFSYLKPYWFQLLLVIIVIFISAILGLLPSIITGRIIDVAILGDDFTYLVYLVLAAIAALTASQIVGVIESYINSWISERIVYDMRNEMFRHLQTMSHKFFTSKNQGEIITRMNSDISGVSSAISSTLTNCVSNIATILTTIVALIQMNWKLAIVGVIVIPLLVLPTRSAGKSRWKLLSKAQQKQDEMNGIVNETLSVSGSLLVKLFTQEEKMNQRYQQVNEEVTQLELKETRAGNWFRVIMGIFTNLGPLLIYLAGGFIIIILGDETLTVGTITATVTLINRLYRPVESLLSISVDFTRSLALFTRIFEYLDMPSDVTNREITVKPPLDHTDIEYNHVRFYYNPDVEVIKDLSFRIPSGKMYALVGPSGEGKSTIVNLLPRLYDVIEGSVSINGIDVRDFDLQYLRSNIGVVTQESYLFNGTIKENLLFAKEDASDEELVEACKVANIHDMIAGLPDGYNTEVGNRGLKLSGGEKQRLSIARVLLKDPKILILDEATSSLDSISEASIQNSLDVLMQNRTSIVIAHRLSTILSADRILVVNDGVIVEEGQHEELLEKNGVYKQLYETQFRKVLDMEAAEDVERSPLPSFKPE